MTRPYHGVQTVVPPETLIDLCSAYAVRRPTGQCFSHVTAARLHDFPLPWRLEHQEELDVCAVMPAAAPRARGARGHRLRAAPRVIDLAGLTVTSPPETWCQIAPLLTDDDVVVAADHVFHLWPEEPDRVRALLREAIDRPGRVGRARLLAALAEARPGCRSPGETRLRRRPVRRRGILLAEVAVRGR